ncbi:MAG TPA: alkaline phosphatase family protein [Micromonosporaceae bacterium]
MTTVALLAASALVASCTGGPSPPAPIGAGTPSPDATGPGGARPVPRAEHVVVVVLENRAATQVIGDPQAPWLNGLAARGALFTDAHAVTHPSQPNYLALFSGDTHGVIDDHCPVSLSGPTLAGQLRTAGGSFVGYSEGLPEPGYTGCSAGRYARKHAPWVDFPDLGSAVDQPLTALPRDFAALPTVAFVIPDLCHDMHDCSVATGDAWLRDHLDGYLTWAASHRSVLVVTFDEDDRDHGNHIATIVAGARVVPGRYGDPVDHYRLLRTVEALCGLGGIGEATRRTPVTDIWIG